MKGTNEKAWIKPRIASQWLETEGTYNDHIEPRMGSQWWQIKGTNEQPQIELRMTSQWLEIKGTNNEPIQNVGWHPNVWKPKQQRTNIDTNYDGVTMMRTERYNRLILGRT